MTFDFGGQTRPKRGQQGRKWATDPPKTANYRPATPPYLELAQKTALPAKRGGVRPVCQKKQPKISRKNAVDPRESAYISTTWPKIVNQKLW
mgnify:FL=1